MQNITITGYPLLLVLVLTGVHLNAAERPNVIIILVDDMGFSDIGAYGGEIKTPHIDSLAQGGVRFSQFYNASRCCPTRATLMTGLHPHLTGIGHMTNSPKQKNNASRKWPIHGMHGPWRTEFIPNHALRI